MALTPPWASSDTTLTVVDIPDLSGCAANPARIDITIDGPAGARYLGPPADGLTVDDLAAQNLVQGVPGYDPGAELVTLFTAYDAATSTWLPSAGTGEALRLGRAFQWRMLDDGPSGSASLPFTLFTGRPPNEAPVRVTLDTAGSRMNLLANPFGVPLDLSTVASWPGADNLSPGVPVWTYDPVVRTWVESAGVIGPWEAFRVRAKGPRASGQRRVLTIPAEARAPAAARQAAQEPRLAFTLTGADAEGLPLADRALTIRFRDGASAAFDPDEDAEKLQVPAPAYALLSVRSGAAVVGADVRPFAAAEIPLAVEARGTGGTFTLAWDAAMLPAGLPVVLVDLASGTEVDVRRQSSLTVALDPLPALAEIPTGDLADGSAATDRFVLRIGTGAVVGEGVSEVSLSPVAPNPSSGTARVGFAIPEAGPVRLTVVDVRGREVAVLVDGAMPAGRHTAGLDGRALAAGVYTIRLEAGGTVLTRQAVVVR
jgi:hypothetical protein